MHVSDLTPEELYGTVRRGVTLVALFSDGSVGALNSEKILRGLPQNEVTKAFDYFVVASGSDTAHLFDVHEYPTTHVYIGGRCREVTKGILSPVLFHDDLRQLQHAI